MSKTEKSEPAQPTTKPETPAPVKPSLPKPPAPPAAEPKPKAALLTVDDLARVTGNTIELRGHALGVRDNPKQKIATPNAHHQAAAALHGWRAHRHHEGEPMRLGRKDYEAAIEAVRNPPKRRGIKPHKAAISPHCPHSFARE